MEEISGVAFIFNQKFFQELREATGWCRCLESNKDRNLNNHLWFFSWTVWWDGGWSLMLLLHYLPLCSFFTAMLCSECSAFHITVSNSLEFFILVAGTGLLWVQFVFIRLFLSVHSAFSNPFLYAIALSEGAWCSKLLVGSSLVYWEPDFRHWVCGLLHYFQFGLELNHVLDRNETVRW